MDYLPPPLMAVHSSNAHIWTVEVECIFHHPSPDHHKCYNNQFGFDFQPNPKRVPTYKFVAVHLLPHRKPLFPPSCKDKLFSRLERHPTLPEWFHHKEESQRKLREPSNFRAEYIGTVAHLGHPTCPMRQESDLCLCRLGNIVA
tara:strand:+ start:12990 stop:13421 length:432 start_codon:yes stop_codon:yes gene_type:complete